MGTFNVKFKQRSTYLETVEAVVEANSEEEAKEALLRRDFLRFLITNQKQEGTEIVNEND